MRSKRVSSSSTSVYIIPWSQEAASFAILILVITDIIRCCTLILLTYTYCPCACTYYAWDKTLRSKRSRLNVIVFTIAIKTGYMFRRKSTSSYQSIVWSFLPLHNPNNRLPISRSDYEFTSYKIYKDWR